MLKKKEKTGYSEAAFAAVITSGALGLLPLFDVSISNIQAINLGLFIASVVGFGLRMLHKLVKRVKASRALDKDSVKRLEDCIAMAVEINAGAKGEGND